MTVAQFLNYIQYSTSCPFGITPARWKAMIASLKRIEKSQK
jgi:hypothetical protein